MAACHALRPPPAPTTTKVPGSPASSAAPTTTTTTTTQPRDLAPLTHLPLQDPSVATRPAVLVKIDNAPAARPQSGLDHADVVYEEVVEGGITRYLAVFQSRGADPVGPVRSVRRTDADVVAPIGGLFAYSGGIPAFVAEVRATGVVDVGANDDGSAYYRDSSRASPHNLYTSTSTLRRAAPPGLRPPPALFRYRAPGQPLGAAGASPAASVRVVMSAVSADTWTWRPSSSTWVHEIDGVTQTLADGATEQATNVIVEEVPYVGTGFVDPAGNPVPDAQTVGSGGAWFLSGGRVAQGSWSKPSDRSVTRFTDSAGAQLRLAPGTTWVLLAPTGATVAPSSG
ncbi:MAG: DUF3048 domain-containing protein [Acidimicrobiales bacterium]